MGGSNMHEVYESNLEAGMSSLAIVNTDPNHPVPINAPIVASYNDRIRPLLDTIDRLRNLNVMKEGIQLPTIVVVGDQSSGKSSVLESLAGISLPRGDNICTRVPLVMRLQKSLSPKPQIWLEVNGKKVDTDEEHITEAIRTATDEIAGSGNGVSDTPLTLHVKKISVPDLTMVDLPGITRVPVKGQPEDIYEQISRMIMKYIEPQETIILNVLAATVDFTTCESIRMSRQVDKTGERTLAVVTKADMAPEGLLQKVTADDVNIGLGYVCVRNRVGQETYQEARIQEELLFKEHPLLSLIDQAIVGIPVLAQKLIQIQAKTITRCLPDIVHKIKEKLQHSILELNKLPMVISSREEAGMTFQKIIHSAKEALKKILIHGEFSEYLDDANMSCTARLATMLSEFSNNLQTQSHTDTDFLMDEIKVLEECKGIRLPNFIPSSAFLVILSRRVDKIRRKPVKFIEEIWAYVERVLLSVLVKYSENYPQILPSIKRSGSSLISKIVETSLSRVIEFVEMEKLTDYTSNPEYMTVYSQRISEQETFVSSVRNNHSTYQITGLGNVGISHLRKYDADLLRQAFDVNVRINAYWTIVVRRIVDYLALYVSYTVKNMVNSQFEAEFVCSSGGRVAEKMMEESQSVASKREKLKKSISLLKESKEAVAAIVDQYSI